ncbi:MAG TPA: TolC family protein, partial [Nitrospira sp.]|nr:TolC family protein [Nitrospira sp.]
MTSQTLTSLALLTALALPALAGAQPSGSPETPGAGRFLGLQQAIEAGLQNHPIVQEANAGLLASTARTDQSKSLYYPQVYANADGSAGSGRINPRFLIGGGLLQPNLSTYTAGVLASQRIYDFGFTKNLVESSQYGERAQEQDVNARRALVIVSIQRSYLNSLKRQRLVRIAEETVRERGVITGQIETLYRQQLKSKLDLDLVKVELVNAESLLVRSRNDLKASFADLN